MSELTLAIYIIIGLSVLLVAQQVFWLINVHKLVNKAMSRDYSEYVQSEVIKSQTSARKKPNEEEKEFKDDFSVLQAEKANTLFGFSGS